MGCEEDVEDVGTNGGVMGPAPLKGMDGFDMAGMDELDRAMLLEGRLACCRCAAGVPDVFDRFSGGAV